MANTKASKAGAAASIPETLDDVRSAATPNTFPARVLEGVGTVADLFGAGFYGQNSAVHLFDAGVKYVTVVDTDGAKLAGMRRLYCDPPARYWNFLTMDAREFARGMHPGTFDVVIVDPWTQAIAPAVADLGLWLRLARRCVVIGVDLAWFAKFAPECAEHPTADGLEAGLRAAMPNLAGFRVAELRKRSDHAGGVWWAVVEVKPCA